MAYWLIKTEPGTWSWDDQARDGTTFWDGVRNHQAANNLKAMKKGDQCLFYHSGGERRVMGTVSVVREYYPDPSDQSGRFGMVDVKLGRAFKRPVTLQEIKQDGRLGDLALVRQPRLSVIPVPEKAWAIICKMGGIAP